MRGLYHSSIYDAGRAVPSYWEATAPEPVDRFAPLAGDETCDVAVIGGGFTGLSAALHLARDYGVDARVLEAGHIGWGASGRNGGFCCLAATKLSPDAMIKDYGLEETKRFYAAQLDGIELVKALGEDEGIDFDRQGDGLYIVAHHPSRVAELRAEGEAMTRHFGVACELHSSRAFQEIGHGGTEQHGALHMAAGFGIHPLKFTLGLGAAAARRGAKLHPHSEVTAWDKADGWHRLTTAGGTLRARRVILACNGFIKEGLDRRFDARLLPVLSNIVVTRPLSDEELSAESWHTETPTVNTRQMLFYYRLLTDKRFLIGARGDTTGRPEDGERMRIWLTRRVGEVFPAWRDVEMDYFWRGLVCMTRDLRPAIGRLDDDPSVFYGFGYHGNGVNTAPWAGRTLAHLIAGSNEAQPDLPRALSGLPPRFPLPGLRTLYLRGALHYYRWKDDKTLWR